MCVCVRFWGNNVKSEIAHDSSRTQAKLAGVRLNVFVYSSADVLGPILLYV